MTSALLALQGPEVRNKYGKNTYLVCVSSNVPIVALRVTVTLITHDAKYKLMEIYQIIKCLNQIISANKPYNLRHCTFTLHTFFS